jgi:hypothetical protein
LPEQDIDEPVNHFMNSFLIEKPDEVIQNELNKEISPYAKINVNHSRKVNNSLFSNPQIEKLKISPKKDGKTIFIEDLNKLKHIIRKEALYDEMKVRLKKSNKKLNLLRNSLKFSKVAPTAIDRTESKLLTNIKSHPYYSVIDRNLKDSFKSYFQTPSKLHMSFY